jgi:hypothetical protein
LLSTTSTGEMRLNKFGKSLSREFRSAARYSRSGAQGLQTMLPPKVLSWDLRGRGRASLPQQALRSTFVAPGWIPTERHADAPQDELESYARSVPMQHMGNENDIAKMVTFLASDDAGFITGQKFSVNGGNTLA